jgi:anti-sigma regulatory factor (Ser/Thr protein kinase)/ketosteroid isomerase-like protein
MAATQDGPNAVIVKRLLHAFRAGDDDTVLELVDPEIELVPLVVRAGLVSEPYRGIDGLRSYLGDAEAAAVERAFLPRRLRAVGETVVVFGHVLHDDDDATRTPVIWVWRVRDGRATHGAVVSDEAVLRKRHRRFAPPTPRSAARSALWLELPAEPVSVGEARHALRVWVDNLTLTRAECDTILLALSEAATNAVRHAYPSAGEDDAFRVGAMVHGRELLVTVEDDGVGLDTLSRTPGLGVGLPLLDRLAATVALVGAPERPRGTEVRMWFPLESPAP